ncbi:MAG TPA: PEP-CTERM sorting domain-containing protein [Terriglobales bacterium]|nr:PEP-CTERM sorting domain-containing protein [Terriglobales bacterium]
MKLNRVLWCLSLFFVLCSIAFADDLPPGDPRMVIDDPICDSNVPCAPLVTPGVEFTFTAGADGNTATPGSFQVSGGNFFNLDVETFGAIDPSLVNCESNKFSCVVTDLGDVTDMFFSIPVCEAEVCSGGFPNGDVFTITLQGWQVEQEFFAIANLSSRPTSARISAPEPSVVLLLGTGVLAIVGRKRYMLRT